jgi:hypothetical protein
VARFELVTSHAVLDAHLLMHLAAADARRGGIGALHDS